MKYVEQGTPALDQVINVSKLRPRERVVRDLDGDLWFEFEPGRFHMSVDGTREDAWEFYRRTRTNGNSLTWLQHHLGGVFVDE